MNTTHVGLSELTNQEQHAISGGDWWERYWGFMVTTAFLGGALAAPGLLAVSAMTGASLLITDTAVSSGWTWF